MTSEEVKLILEKACEKDYTISAVRGRREKRELFILLGFMYYSHLKMVDVLKLTPKHISREGGWYYSDRYKKVMGFEIHNDFYPFLISYIFVNKIENDDFLISVKKRALIYAFKQIALENGITGCRITDVLYAGERDNANCRKPYIIKGNEMG